VDALPPWPPFVEVREVGPSPRYYRETKPIVGVGLRVSPKFVTRLEDTEGFARAAFGFDVHAVGRLGVGRGRTFGLWPELGYVQTGVNGRFASLGLGVASQTPPLETTFLSGLSLGVVPHLLVGRREGESAIGARTSLLAELYLDDGNAWGIELCHQSVRSGDHTTHELAIGLSLTWMAKRWP
jgi:hypothetical protein